MTGDKKRATSSIRISLSYISTKEEIDEFLSSVITQVERMIEESKLKNEIIISKEQRIKELEEALAVEKKNKEKLEHYERMEETLNNAVNLAQRTSEQIRNNAQRDSQFILEDARKNASRIVNEALLKAEKTEMEAESLKRNVNIFKRKLRGIIQSQLEMVDDIEKVEF